MRTAYPLRKLGDVCEIIGGGTPSKANKAFYAGDILWATVRDMNADVIEDTEFKITREAVKQSATNIIPPNNVVIATRVGLGKVCLTRHSTAINQDLRGVLPKKDSNLSVRHLFWWFKSVATEIEKEGKGATVKGVTLPFVRSLEIPVPPLAEQKRIVAILGESFQAAETAESNFQRNTTNAQELFERELNAAMSLTDDSEMTTLGDEIELKVGFAFKSAEFTVEQSDVRLLRGDNIVPGATRWEDAKRYPAKQVHEFQQFALAENDVVLAMDRPWVSAGLKRAQIAADDLPCLLVQRVARLRGKPSLDSRFLYHLIGTRRFIGHLVGNQTGLGVPHISGQQIKDFEFRKPSLKAQRMIASRLDEVRVESERLLGICFRKRDAIGQLRKSMLKSAFSGKL